MAREPRALRRASLGFVDPGPIVAIPLHRPLEAFRESNARLPAQLTFDLAAVERVAAIMPGTVGHEADEGARLAAEIEERFGQLQVRQLAAAADVVDLADATLPPDAMDRRAVV